MGKEVPTLKNFKESEFEHKDSVLKYFEDKGNTLSLLKKENKELEAHFENVNYAELQQKIDKHVKNLELYNEFKDNAMSILEAISNIKQSNIKDTAREFDIDIKE